MKIHWTLDQLRHFVSTAELGGFSAAARHLGKAQSAVSTSISLLEADFGVDLFDRSRRSVKLTDAGHVLLREARDLLRQAGELEERAQHLSSGSETKLVLALDRALPPQAINALCVEISEHAPELEVSLLWGTTREVVARVDAGECDAAFAVTHEVRRGHLERTSLSTIGTVPQGLFVGTGHPLLSEAALQRKHLARYRQLLLLGQEEETPVLGHRVWRSDDLYWLANWVAEGLGWAVLPLHVAEQPCHAHGICRLHAPALELVSPVVKMLWARGRPLGPFLEWLGGRFREQLRPRP